MKKTFYLIIFSSCLIGFAGNERELLADKTVKSVFSKEEIYDLAIILDFFESHIYDTATIKTKADIYLDFLREEERRIKENDFDNKFIIEFNDLKILYTKIKESTFKKIWLCVNCRGFLESPRLSKCIAINIQGKFITLLKKAGKTNEHIKQYHDDIIMAGSLSPTNYTTINYFYEDLNLNNIISRLLIAVHYITSFDNWLRYDYFNAQFGNFEPYPFSEINNSDWFEIYFKGSANNGEIIFQIVNSANNIIYKDIFEADSIVIPDQLDESYSPRDKMNYFKNYIDNFFTSNIFFFPPGKSLPHSPFIHQESFERLMNNSGDQGFHYRVSKNKWKYVIYSKELEKVTVSHHEN